MSKRNRMPGLREKGGIWHIEKRCKYCESGWLRESTGATSRAEAEEYLIRRLAELESAAERRLTGAYTFEEAALKYLEEVAHKPSADDIATHIDQLLPFVGHLVLEACHDDTFRPFVEHELARGLSPKSINNALGVAATTLRRSASHWRTPTGAPWLRHAAPVLTRLETKGKRAKTYPLSWEEQDRMFRLLPRHSVDCALYGVNTGCREQEIVGLKWEWEVPVPSLDTSIFVLPEAVTKTGAERVVVLNSIAKRVIEGRRELRKEGDVYVFTYRGKRLGKMRTTSWRKAWIESGLPDHPMIRKGVHNLRHTFGRRLRAAGVPRETRKLLLGHACGDITTHYSAAELGELIAAVEKITNRGIAQTPALSVVGVGKVSEAALRATA